MSALISKVKKLREAVGLPHSDRYLHTDVTRIPMYIRRAIFQTEYACRLSQIQDGKHDALIHSAVDHMLDSIRQQGALTLDACATAEKILLPLSEEAKGYTVHMVSHAHIDMNWMWPYHETVSVTLETFRTVLQLMREYPEFTYAQSQASTYQIVEKHEPEMLDEIKQRIHEGRWEVSASTWVEADKNMPNEESMARHLLYTKQYLSNLLDIDPSTLTLDYEPDTFGHSANVPEILNQGGVKYYYHCRGYEGHSIYRWRGQSGAEVLVFCEPTWYLGDTSPNFALYVPDFCEKHGLKDAIKVYGVGDHGGGPTRRDLNLIEEMKTWPVFPTLKYSSYQAFYAKLEEKRDAFPVVEQELNYVFTGCYTTQCRVKASNRIGEAVLTEAETLSAGAKLLANRNVRSEALGDGWKNILFSQFHDILTGSGVRDTREYAMSTFSQTLATANTQKGGAMRSLVNMIDTSMIQEAGCQFESYSEGAGVGYCGPIFFKGMMVPGGGFADRGSSLTRIFHLFNPTDHARREVTEVTVWDYPGDLRSARAYTLGGDPVEFQILSSGNDFGFLHTYDRVLVDVEVPAFGWTTIVFDTQETDAELKFPGDPRVHYPDEFHLENEYLRAEFDVNTGALVSLLDKESGREMLSAPAGFFTIDEDTDKGMSSWVVGRYMRREPLSGHVHVKYGVCGELRQSLELSARFGEGGSELTCTISLDKGARHLDFQTICDWKEVGTPRTFIPQLSFAVPYAQSSRLLYDIPAGSIYRAPLDIDVPACRFAAALPGEGAALMLSTDSKYGFRSCQDTLQVTLIRASYDPDLYPERGLHEFKISVSVRPEREASDLIRAAGDAARPLDYLTARPHHGTLPATGSFLQMEGGDVRLSATKWSEDGKALILRLVNYGAASEASVTLPQPPAAAWLSNALEAPVEPLSVSGNKITFPVRANAMITLRVE